MWHWHESRSSASNLPDLVFVSQAGSWSVLGPWKPWVWSRPWCSSPTCPSPVTIRPWPPCPAKQASVRCNSTNRSSISWKASNQRLCTPVMTTRSQMFLIFCSPVSTGCVRNSCCGLWSGPSLCQVTALFSQGHQSCCVGHPLAGLTKGLSVKSDSDRRQCNAMYIWLEKWFRVLWNNLTVTWK